MHTITLTILANFAVMLLDLYVALSPKFRPISWFWFRLLMVFAALNFIMVIINTVRLFTV